MRRLIFRPLSMLLAFLTGLALTFLITFMGDEFGRLLDEPSDTIPALCSNGEEFSAFCTRTGEQEREESAVYAALIMQQMRADDRRTYVVVQHETVKGSHHLSEASGEDHLDGIFESLRWDFPLAERETLLSFRTNNQQHYPINRPLPLPIKTTLIRRQEVESFSASEPGSWWAAFYRKYPGADGFFVLSKVGFNSEMNQALVYRAFSCDSTCGHGSYVLLVKEAGVWRIKAQAGSWIS